MRYFPSKILLFGEYLLLLGARALALPVPAFRGAWAEDGSAEGDDDLAESLRAFAHSTELGRLQELDSARFRQEVSAGLSFRSNIPLGYGLGSSGALCAAVYDRYAFSKTSDLSELKTIFAAMESYFHGQSSGLDPLTSYLNRALCMANRNDVQYFEARPWFSEKPVIFLLDTKIPRQTGPLVQWFLTQSRRPEFMRSIENDLLPAHDALFDAWQYGRRDLFWKALREVSAFQLESMQPMIPEFLRADWASCLAGTDVALKICGAGGGGFMLGFGTSREIVLKQLKHHTILFPFETYAVVEK